MHSPPRLGSISNYLPFSLLLPLLLSKSSSSSSISISYPSRFLSKLLADSIINAGEKDSNSIEHSPHPNSRFITSQSLSL